MRGPHEAIQTALELWQANRPSGQPLGDLSPLLGADRNTNAVVLAAIMPLELEAAAKAADFDPETCCQQLGEFTPLHAHWRAMGALLCLESGEGTRQPTNDATDLIQQAAESLGVANPLAKGTQPLDPDVIDQIFEVIQTGCEAVAEQYSAPRSIKPATGELAQLWESVSELTEGRFEQPTEPPHVGGMGVVWFTRDTRTKRAVAVKTLRPELLDNTAARTAFRNEVQNLCRVRHLNILPVHEFWDEQDGPLVFSTPHYQGGTLRDLITEVAGSASRQTPGLLEQFAQLCFAVDAAHAAGIYHFDVTSRNVLIDSGVDGKQRPQLILGDWGLSSTSPTRDTAGTPGYIAPEKADPDREASGPADIYSLGVVLYELVRGKRATAGVAATVDSNPESKFIGDLKGNRRDCVLIAVANRAMHARPADRFGSARELGERVLAFLRRDEVPECDTLGMKVSRFVRLHPRKTTAVAVAIGMTLLASAFFFNRRAAAERREREFAENAQLQIRSEQKRVQTAVSESMDAVEALLAEPAIKTLGGLPNGQQVRQRLVERSIEFFEAIAAAEGESIEFQVRRSRALAALSRLKRESGAHEESARLLQDSIATMESLEKEAGSKVGFQRIYQAILRDAGILKYQTGDFPEAERLTLKSAEYGHRIAQESGRPGDYTEPAAGLANLSIMLLGARKPAAEVQKHMDNAMQWIDGLDDLEAKDMNRIAGIHAANARLRTALGDKDGSLKANERSVKILGAIADQHPGVLMYQTGYAKALGNSAISFKRMSKLPEARKRYRRTIELWERICGQHPGNVDGRFQLSANKINLANIDAANGPELRKQAHAIRVKLYEEFPENRSFKSGLSISEVAVAEDTAKSGDRESAVGQYETAIERWRSIKPPSKVEIQQLSVNLCNYARHLAKAGRIDDCLAAIRESLSYKEPTTRGLIRRILASKEFAPLKENSEFTELLSQCQQGQ